MDEKMFRLHRDPFGNSENWLPRFQLQNRGHFKFMFDCVLQVAMVHVKAVLSVWGTFYQLVPKPVQLQKKFAN